MNTRLCKYPESVETVPGSAPSLRLFPESGRAPDEHDDAMNSAGVKHLHSERRRVGLLAGNGRFPIAFARAAAEQDLSVICVGISGMTDPELPQLCRTFATTPLGRIGRAIRLFKRAGVDRVVMAGKVEKKTLFERFLWIRHLPDWRALHMLYHYCRENKKDDTLLLAVIREFERDRIYFESALEYCPELLVTHGFLTRRKPSPAQWKDIRFGWELAKEMGRLDVGQTVAVCDQAVLAVEAVEGTDAAIQRAGELCQRGGFTVVKVAKPQQDMRFDVPTIGVQTIQSMQEAGARVLAIETGRTILLDQPEVLALADKFGIAVVSLKSEELQLRAAG